MPAAHQTTTRGGYPDSPKAYVSRIELSSSPQTCSSSSLLEWMAQHLRYGPWLLSLPYSILGKIDCTALILLQFTSQVLSPILSLLNQNGSISPHTESILLTAAGKLFPKHSKVLLSTLAWEIVAYGIQSPSWVFQALYDLFPETIPARDVRLCKGWESMVGIQRTGAGLGFLDANIKSLSLAILTAKNHHLCSLILAVH